MDKGLILDIPHQDELVLRAKARMKETQKTSARTYTQHPWPFLRECVWTLDQITQQERRYPRLDDPFPGCPCAGPGGGGCENYLHHMVNRWLANKKFIVPKSRRMIVSWTFVALHYWLARFFPGSSVAFGSRKEGKNDSEGAAELVRRAWFIHEHVPDTVEPVDAEYNFCRLKFPKIRSEIIGIAQGAHQLRQYTFTALFMDEMAFWEEAHDTYSASIPTLEGGGRFTGVSSAHPGFFKQLTFDNLDGGLT